MGDSIISDLDEAIALQTESIGVLKRIKASVIESGSSAPVPIPPAQPTLSRITLPKESSSELNRFYGTASRDGGYLQWFNFPISGMKLYSREGANMSDHTGDLFDDHRCHKLIANRLEAAYIALYRELGHEEFHKQGWHVYSGCFNYRTKVGGSSLSTHAWGIAVDANGAENPYASAKTTFSDRAIDIMEEHGFLSGGRAWGKDWMHFQAAIPYISSGSYYAKHGLPKHIVQA